MNPRYEAWLAMLDRRDAFMVNLFILSLLALGYYLFLVRGNRRWATVALTAGGVMFYGSLVALFYLAQ